MSHLFIFILFVSQSVLASSLCYGIKSNHVRFDQTHSNEFVIYPVFCESNEAADIDSLKFDINVPVDVLAYKISVVNPHQEVTNDYLNIIVQNDLGIITDNYGTHFVWVEPGTTVTIDMKLDKTKFEFKPMTFLVEYEPYLYKH